MTLLAVAIMVDGVESALAQAALAAERGADMVELRVDRFTQSPPQVAEMVERCPLPCILTCRPIWEGGEYEGDEEARLAVFEAALSCPHPPAYLDVEWEAYEHREGFADRLHPLLRLSHDTGLILSSHDFQTRPSDLLQRIEGMLNTTACRVIKAAWRARSLRDNLEAFELLASALQPTIALCMGEFGLPSRVLARKFGAFLTFAGLDDATLTAPGQVGVMTMKNLYRWDAINADTAVYGVIGWPVGHSLSPHIHNGGFGAIGHNGVYLPMPIPPEYEHFKATVGAWVDDLRLDFRGASVTIPHKENLLRFVRERGGMIEPLAAKIGAANTLTVRPDGSLYASNTDYAAALDAVCHAMGVERESMAGKRIAVIGAGGAARAIVAAFAQHGATVVIYNRTLEKAQQIAEEFNRDQGTKGPRDQGDEFSVPRSLDPSVPSGRVVAAALDSLCKSCCEVYINCTPVGMHPKVEESPITDWPKVKPGTVVFDTIYNPAQTKLLREAKAAGCTTVSGMEMFVRQAAGQFELWTGKPAPVEVFERALRERLKS